jgi:hypothetical protein
MIAVTASVLAVGMNVGTLVGETSITMTPSNAYAYLNICVYYLCHIGWVYVFYVGHVDRIYL